MFRLPQHRTFFEADADCAAITSQMPWVRSRRWLETGEGLRELHPWRRSSLYSETAGSRSKTPWE